MKCFCSRECLLLWVALLAGVSMAAAGGFHLSVETPTSPPDPEFKNAALLVRTFGCHQPTDASVFATAEGLVEGRRQTIKLQLRPTSKGVYAIEQQWPSRGIWLVAIDGSYLTFQSSALVELGPNGQAVMGKDGAGTPTLRISPRKLSRKEIEDALRAQVMRLGDQQAAK